MNKIVIFVVLSLISLEFHSQNQDEVLKKRIDSVITTQMRDRKGVGYSVGIVRNGSIFYTKGYGFKEIGKPDAVDSLTNFHVASISKVFVATLIMQLVEQGKLNLDGKLVDFVSVPATRDRRIKEVTIRQLMTHLSGFPDLSVRAYHWTNPKNDSLALGNYAKRCMQNRKLLFDPGSKWAYSNMAFEILGHVIEAITGESFDTYEKRNILDKAGLSSSNFDYRQIDAERRSSPHVKKWNHVRVSRFYPYNREHSPSGTLNSSAHDLCLWMVELLNIYRDTSMKHQGVVNRKTLMKMWTPVYKFPQGSSIGLTWFLENSPFGLCATHGGLDPGYSSIMEIYPERNIGIVILVNGDYIGSKLWSSMSVGLANLLFRQM